jgi:hypothetical protein
VAVTEESLASHWMARDCPPVSTPRRWTNPGHGVSARLQPILNRAGWRLRTFPARDVFRNRLAGTT